MREHIALLMSGALCAGFVYACSSSDGGSGNTGSSSGGTASSSGGKNAGGGAGESDGGTSGSSNHTGGQGIGGDAGSDGSGGSGAESADAGFPDVPFIYDPVDAGSGNNCANVMADADEISRPVDIIVSIDNSGSMSDEIEAVQQRINTDFATILETSNIDYRVIMVSRYGYVNQSIAGSDNPVCVGPPLGLASCTNNNHPMLELNPPRYYHHSTDIESRNMWCRLLASYDSPDEVEDGGGEARDANDPHFPWQPVAPNGWQDWLRADSFKIFVAITDDAPNGNGCSYADSQAGASAFDRDLRELAPEHFGAYDPDDPNTGRNYAWYSIVGMVANDPPTTPWPPSAPIQAGICPDTGGGAGEAAGRGYQALSIMTEALRYPSCLNDDFDAVFSAIADGVIDSSAVPCEFDFPEVEGIINPNAIEVSFIPGNGDPPRPFDRVDTAGDCAGEEVYFDDNANPTKVLLCPEACNVAQSDPDASISLDFGCLGS